METEIKLLRKIAEKKIKLTKWDNSIFKIIKNMSTTEKGDVGEIFILQLYKNKVGEDCKRNKKKRDSWDIKLFRKKIEVKTATEDTTGKFQFNGIRYHREYDFLMVLGISPNDIYFNIYTDADVKTHKVGKLVSMEKGTIGSHKLTKKKTELYNINQFKIVMINLKNNVKN